jgi:hypothetical protein
MKSRSKEEQIYDLIGRYATAQSLLGIKKTLKIKRRVAGYRPLQELPIGKLKTIIRILRREYVKLQNRR